MQPTDEQQQVIEHTGSHAKVVAVAGSGKTATLVGHVAEAVRTGMRPQEITVVMFNVDAAKDFANRLDRELLDIHSARPDVRTFNSMGEKLTRRFEDLGVLPKRKLVTQDYVIDGIARQVLKSVIDESNLQIPPSELLEDFLLFIDLVKSGLSSAKEVFHDLGVFRYPEFITAFDRFETMRKEKALRTFADQLWETVRLLVDRTDLRRGVENRMELVVVDEFQDVSEIQIKMIEIIAGSRARVVGVGDVDQTIYSWRGAMPDFLLNEFQETFKGKQYKLTRTFRYGHRLSLFANHCIRNNTEREDTFCISAPGTPNTLVAINFEKTGEPSPILGLIRDWEQQGRKPEEFTVLVRLRAQAARISLELLTAGIRFRLHKIPFVLEQPFIDGLVGFLELHDGNLFREGNEERIANLLTLPPAGLPSDLVKRAARQAIEQQSAAPLRNLTQAIKSDYPRSLFANRIEWITNIPERIRGASAAVLIDEYLRQHGILESLERTSSTASKGDEKCIAITAFIDYLKAQQLSSVETVERVKQLTHDIHEGNEGVLITTVHQSKGLEYPCVVVAGLEDHKFPYTLRPETADVESERRLFYVAVTRAKEYLHLIAPMDKLLLKRIEEKDGRHPPLNTIKASRFLYESNLGLSDAVATALEDNDPQSLKDMPPHPYPWVANRYLRVIQPKGSLVQIPVNDKPPKPEKSKDKGKRPIRIRHESLGEGSIADWTGEDTAYVKFDEGKEGWFVLSKTPHEVLR